MVSKGGKYHAVQCDNCGKWRLCIIEDMRKYRFKCHYCNKGKKIIHEDKPGLQLKVMGGFFSEQEAQKYCSALKANHGMA